MAKFAKDPDGTKENHRAKGEKCKKKRILKVFGIIVLREQKACDRVENDSVSGGFISFPINVRYLVPNI